MLYPGCNGGPYEKELLNDLFKNYNVQNRPVLNESSPIVITFGVTLQQIVDLVQTLSAPFIRGINIKSVTISRTRRTSC